MERERLLAETFVVLADSLVGDYDVEEFLHMLAERCAAVVDAAAVGVLLADERGKLRLASASTHEMESLELLEMQQEQGPCWEAYRDGEQVIETDLEESEDRWPAFTPRALELGFGSVHAFPLKLRGQTLGALNVFFHRSGRFSETDVFTLQALADVATVAIVQERSGRESSELTKQLQGALDSRVVIEQAKGVLAEQSGEELDRSFERLRRHARQHNLRLRDVARHVVEHRQLPQE